jgi:hypothetical protein
MFFALTFETWTLGTGSCSANFWNGLRYVCAIDASGLVAKATILLMQSQLSIHFSKILWRQTWIQGPKYMHWHGHNNHIRITSVNQGSNQKRVQFFFIIIKMQNQKCDRHCEITIYLELHPMNFKFPLEIPL